MPGLYGGLGVSGEVLEQLRREFERIWGPAEHVEVPGGSLGGHAHGDHQALHVAAEGDHLGVDGEWALYVHAERFIREGRPALYELKDGHLHATAYCKGNAVWIAADGRTLRIASETMGTFPLYWATVPGGVVFCSHLRPLGRALGAKPDPTGMVLFGLRGFTYMGRTPFQGIRRLLPGQTVVWDSATGRTQIGESSLGWAKQYQGRSPGDLIDEGRQIMREAVERCLPDKPRCGLMTSGGWDSRCLLGYMEPHLGRDRMLVYSHGHPESRELAIVKRCAEMRSVPCRLEPMHTEMYEPASLDRWFERTELVIFPYWPRAGDLVAAAGYPALACGVGNLGGHDGRVAIPTGWRRVACLSMYLLHLDRWLPRERFGDRITSAGFPVFARYPNFDQLPWYVRAIRGFDVNRVREETAEDLRQHFDRLRARGIDNTDQMIEAHIYETRVLQPMMGQHVSCRGGVDIVNIYGDRELYHYASWVPYPILIYNKVMQGMMRKDAPDLLRAETAATLVSANAPILMQEASRLVRVWLDGASVRLHHRTKGKWGRRVLGWLDFEHLRDGRILHRMVDSMDPDVIDIGAVRQFIDRGVVGRESRDDLYNAAIHVLKLYNLDRMLRS